MTSSISGYVPSNTAHWQVHVCRPEAKGTGVEPLNYTTFLTTGLEAGVALIRQLHEASGSDA